MAIPPQKRIRARRARARQHPRPHDLRDRYRQPDLPDSGHLAVVSVDDPYSSDAAYLDRTGNLDAAARLQPAVRRDGSFAPGAPEWAPPRKPQVAAIRNLRGDTIGRMHSRRQVSEVQYTAARRYQELVEKSTGALHSLDPERPVIDCVPMRDPLPPFRITAAKQLRALEAELKDWYGGVGLGLVRAALTDGNSLAAIARTFGASSDRELRNVSWLFRRALDCLARALGLASSTRPPPRPTRANGVADPALDPARHADTTELGDLRLRRGRPNGHQ